MRAIEAGFEILDEIDGERVLRDIERYARVCYKSESAASEDSARAFVARILRSGHESVIEHEKVTVKVVCDRGVSHEIVRHRIASYSQESTRYCNYYKERFGRELTFIRPFFWADDPAKYALWESAMTAAEESYLALIEAGASPQEARSVLPNSLKTEIVVTMNLREWRHFFRLRADRAAHPQMREIAIPMLDAFKKALPPFFDDVYDDIHATPAAAPATTSTPEVT